MTVRRAPQRPPCFACVGVPRRSATLRCNFNTKLAGRTGHDLREALPEREAAGGKDTGAAGPVVRSMSWDGTALKHTVWPVHPSGWKRPADYPIKGE